MFYHGTQTFPQWDGSGLVSGLAIMRLNRIVFDGRGAKSAERWSVGKRIRDVEVPASIAGGPHRPAWGELWRIGSSMRRPVGRESANR